MMVNDNQMKIENEYMTVEFDDDDGGRTLIIRDKASCEICELSIIYEYFSLKNSKKKTEVYLEWGKKAFKK